MHIVTSRILETMCCFTKREKEQTLFKQYLRVCLILCSCQKGGARRSLDNHRKAFQSPFSTLWVITTLHLNWTWGPQSNCPTLLELPACRNKQLQDLLKTSQQAWKLSFIHWYFFCCSCVVPLFRLMIMRSECWGVVTGCRGDGAEKRELDHSRGFCGRRTVFDLYHVIPLWLLFPLILQFFPTYLANSVIICFLCSEDVLIFNPDVENNK